ncbi:zinc finger, CCHC-type containing protein [Tanacetum coccineum]
MMTGTKSDIKKFDGKNDFTLWQVRMKALLEQQGLAAGGSQSEYIDEFHKLVGDLAAIDTAISDEDQAFLLLTSLPSSYDNLVETLLYGRDTMKLEDVVATLNSRELQKMTEAKGDGGEGLYVRRRSGQRDMEQGKDSAWSKSQVRSSRLRCYICQSEEHLKRDCPRYNHKKSQGFVRNEDQVSGSRDDGYDNADVMMAMRNAIYEGHSGKIKVIKGSLVVLSGTRRDNCVYTLDCQAVTKKTLKEVYTTMYEEWVAKHLDVAGLQQQNGLVMETNVTLLAKRLKTPIDMLGFFGWLASIKQGMLEPVKVKCIFLRYHKGIVGNKLWRLDDVTSKVVLYRNMGFNESGKYKKFFIGSGVGTGSMQVLQGDEFEVEPQDGHTFEVEPHGNVDHVVGSQEYREDSNEAAFAVATVEKIYAHELLTFNTIVACKVISKWKAGLKDDMDSRLDVIHNEKLVQTLLKGHSILSLEGSLSGDYDVEKNGKWSCIYAVGSEEYQMVCMRLDIASADVDQSQAAYMTLTEAAKEAIWLKRLAIESGFELKIVVGIATGALSKAIPSPRFQHRIDQEEVFVVHFFWKEQDRSILFGLPGSRQQKFLVLRFFDVKEQQGIDSSLRLNDIDSNAIKQVPQGSSETAIEILNENFAPTIMCL